LEVEKERECDILIGRFSFDLGFKKENQAGFDRLEQLNQVESKGSGLSVKLVNKGIPIELGPSRISFDHQLLTLRG
jgi:hypothetical protein